MMVDIGPPVTGAVFQIALRDTALLATVCRALRRHRSVERPRTAAYFDLGEIPAGFGVGPGFRVGRAYRPGETAWE